MDGKELVERLDRLMIDRSDVLSVGQLEDIKHAIAYITAQSTPQAPQEDAKLTPENREPQYIGWTCGKCGAPVAGGFSKCDKCGRDPKAAPMTEAAGEQRPLCPHGKNAQDCPECTAYRQEIDDELAIERGFYKGIDPKPAEAPTLANETLYALSLIHI